jgi:hypothetical protein
MSYHEYVEGCRISGESHSFHALIQAAMRGADTLNASKLAAAFPDTWAELQARYDAPGGWLPGEVPVQHQDRTSE